MSFQFNSNSNSATISRTQPLSRTQLYSQTRARGYGEHPTILRRRELEDNRVNMNKQVAREFLTHKKAEWEVKTNKVIENNTIQRYARAIRESDEQSLKLRRAKLSAVLQQDDENYRNELGKIIENSHDKAKRMVIEARKYKAEREKLRSEYANQAYERQFRENCDDLRTIDSQFFTEYCAGEVKQQIVDRQARRIELDEEEAEWSRIYEQDRLNKLNKENQRQEQRYKDRVQNKIELKKQIEELSLAQKAAAAQDKKEKEIFQHILAMDAERAKHKQIELIEQKREINRENARYNAELEAKRRAEYEARREEERLELENKMAEYAEDTKRQANNIQQQRQDIIQFRTYLAKRKQEEQRMEAEMQRLIQEDLDRANGQRDLQWEKDRLAREKLMHNVLQTRAQQLQEKQEKLKRDQQDKLYEKQAAEYELQRAKHLESEEEKLEREAALRRKYELEQQIKINRHRQDMAQQLKLAEKEAAEEAERVYRERLQRFKRETVEQSKNNYGLTGKRTNAL